MKNLLKKVSFKLLATLAFIFISASVFADTNTGAQSNESLSAGTVVLYFALLLVLIIAPVFKKSSSRA